jgi:hypothetical protein
MSIQFNNYFNRPIQWSDAQAENTLRAVSLAQKNTTLIHTDLSVTQNNFFTQVIWNIFSLIPCIRNWIFGTNLEYSVGVLQQLKPQIEVKDLQLIQLFNQAVNNVAEFASCLTNELKEQLLISHECIHQHQEDFSTKRSEIDQACLNPENLKNDNTSLDLFQGYDTQEAVSTLVDCQKQWQINSTYLSFARNIEVTSHSTNTFVSFESSSNYSTLLNETDRTIKIFLKQTRCNYTKQLAAGIDQALTDSRLVGSKKITFQLPVKNVSKLNIRDTAQIVASTIKTYVNENPNDFDEITLVASCQNTSHTESYLDHLKKVFD